MRVADIMTADVLTVTPDATVARAVELLACHGYTALPVVAGTGDLVGIVTEVDLLTGRFPHDRRYPVVPGTVGEVMSHPVVTVSSFAEVPDLVEHMWCHRHRGLPVVDHGRLVGFVSRTDLIRMLALRPAVPSQVGRN